MGAEHRFATVEESTRTPKQPNLVGDRWHSEVVVSVPWHGEEVDDTAVAEVVRSYPDSSPVPSEVREEKQNLHE
jgi:hypothetical protein